MEKAGKKSSQLIEIVRTRKIGTVRNLNFGALVDTRNAEDNKWSSFPKSSTISYPPRDDDDVSI